MVDITLNKADFAVLGDIAQNCDQKKLNIAVNEAVLFDMPKLFCGTWGYVQTNWLSDVEKWTNILNEKDFTGCNEVPTYHLGVKAVLAYFAYARYISINAYNDSPVGQVQKTNEFSIPKTFTETNAYSNKYKAMGKSVFENIRSYITLNKETYTEFSPIYTLDCGCIGACNKNNIEAYKTSTIKFRSNTITKY